MIAGTKYIIEDNRTRKRKDLPDLAFFKKKNYKVLLYNANVKVNPDKLNVQDVALDQIHVNTKLFQNRANHYSRESVEKILTAVDDGTFNWELFDPILLWKDENGKLWILSGHSRTEAFRRLCKQGRTDFCTIPAKIIDNITAEQAQQIAFKSNTLSTKETDTERALYYRREREKGRKKKDLLKECKLQEGRNCSFIWRLSFLNPDGELFHHYEAMQNSGTNNAQIKSIADWIGDARETYKFLTDRHEKELYDWLKDKYGRGKGLIYRKTDFIERLNNILKKTDYNPGESLNLKKYDFTSSYKKEYDERVKEAERELTNAKKLLEQKRRELIRRGATGEQLENALTNYYHNVNFWAEELLSRKGDLEKYLEAEKKQKSIFDLSGLGLVVEFFDLSKIKDLSDLKKEYRRLALIYHPDKGGSVEDMQRINEEYDYLFEKIVNGQNLNDDELNNEVELDEKFKEIIDQLTKYPGLNIEVIGSWIWISGATYPIREELKKLGFRFAGKKKMWYWHAGEYRKKTYRHYTIDDLRNMFNSQKVKNYKPQNRIDNSNRRAIGAIEILKQNQNAKADFKGYKPTYPQVDFSKYIKRCKPAKTVKRSGDLQNTIEYIKKAILEHSCEVRKLAKLLKADTIEQTVFNIWHFLRPIDLGGQVNYHFDAPGIEQIRTPAKSWEDRHHGVDCEDLAIFGASILKELAIPFKLKIVGFIGGNGYQHIFVEVPTLAGTMILDPVMKMKFNELPKNIIRDMEINYMSGFISGTDPVIEEIERLAKQGISGLGEITDEVVETAKDFQRLYNLIEAKNMLMLADIDRAYSGQPTIAGLGRIGIWDKIKDKINETKDKIKEKAKDIRDKAHDLWQKAKDNAGKAWDNAKKYGLAPVRGAFLLLLRVNFFGLAKKLYIGYLTQAQAQRYHLDMREWAKAVQGRKKFENFWVSLGGKMDALKRAVTEGWAKKAFNRALNKAGIHGLGVTGVDDAAAVAEATATTSPFWGKVISFFKNINWDKLFKIVDTASKYIPHGNHNNEPHGGPNPNGRDNYIPGGNSTNPNDFMPGKNTPYPTSKNKSSDDDGSKWLWLGLAAAGLTFLLK